MDGDRVERDPSGSPICQPGFPQHLHIYGMASIGVRIVSNDHQRALPPSSGEDVNKTKVCHLAGTHSTPFFVQLPSFSLFLFLLSKLLSSPFHTICSRQALHLDRNHSWLNSIQVRSHLRLSLRELGCAEERFTSAESVGGNR